MEANQLIDGGIVSQPIVSDGSLLSAAYTGGRSAGHAQRDKFELTKPNSGLSLFSDLPEAPGDGTISKSGLAKELGLSKGRISQLVGQGLPVLPNGRLERAVALKWIEENIDQNRRKTSDAPGIVDRRLHSDLKTAKEAEQVKLLQIEVARKLEKLVDRAATENAIVARARLERDAHLNWVMRTAPVLAGEIGADPARTFAALDRMMREHLAELSETPISALQDADSH